MKHATTVAAGEWVSQAAKDLTAQILQLLRKEMEEDHDKLVLRQVLLVRYDGRRCLEERLRQSDWGKVDCRSRTRCVLPRPSSDPVDPLCRNGDIDDYNQTTQKSCCLMKPRR